MPLTAVTTVLSPANLDFGLFCCTHDKTLTSEVLKGTCVTVTEVGSKAGHGYGLLYYYQINSQYCSLNQYLLFSEFGFLF